MQFRGSEPQTKLVASDCGAMVPLRYFRRASDDVKVEPGLAVEADYGAAAQMGMFSRKTESIRMPSPSEALAGGRGTGGAARTSIGRRRPDGDDEPRRRALRPRVALRITDTSSVADVQQWLCENHFTAFLGAFAHYNGHLLLKLDKADFIDICSPAEGIRMHATLRHGRDPPVFPRGLSITTYTQTGT